MDQTQSEFLVELEELIEQIYVDLDALRDTELAGHGRREVIDRIFRRVHSVKGSSASCGLNVVSKIAHEFEDLLDAARVGRVVLDDAVLDTCDSAVDALSESLSLAAAGIVEPSRSQLFERLRAVTRGNSLHGDDDAILKSIPAEIWAKLTEPEKYRLAGAVREGNRLFLISTSFEIESFDEEFFRLKEKLAAWGDVISTSPTVDDLHQDKINFQVLYASAIEAPGLEANLGEFPNVVLNGAVPVALATEPGESSPPMTPTRSSVSSLANFVRIDLETLDRLISTTHELFRRTSNALDLSVGRSDSEELQSLNEELKASFLSVEDELINLRMVSIGPTLQRAARAGRAAARQAEKEIDFEITGGGLRLDKLLADAIADPLIHLIRNAVDHGIENAEARTQAGKSRRGTVKIAASGEGGRSRVSVTDDGRGIDPELVSAAAKQLGIVESEDELDFERSLRLIFRPGFTTVDSVSDLSGRGVGLDVVETAVEQAGGELRVSSKPGIGTTFEIRLPVTFGLMEAQVVVSGGQRYCIAASQTMSGEETGGEQAVTSDHTVRQFSIRELLGQPPPVTQTVSLRTEATEASGSRKGSPQVSQVIFCRFSEERDGMTDRIPKPVRITVDEITGTEKVLVRGLGRHSGRWYGVAGATELSNGSVTLVLDLPRLLTGLE